MKKRASFDISHLDLEKLTSAIKKGVTPETLSIVHQIPIASMIRALANARDEHILNDKQMKKFRKEIIKTPFPYSAQKRMEHILSATNSSIKQALLLQQKEYSVSMQQIQNELTANGVNLIPQTIQNILINSFVPAGLLQREVFPAGSSSFSLYKLTRYGKEFGQPWAAFMLNYSVDNNMCFYKNLGLLPAQNDDDYGHQRLRILKSIIDGNYSLSDIVDSTKISVSSVGAQLSQLEELGVVYKKPSVQRTWIKGKSPASAAKEISIQDIRRIAQEAKNQGTFTKDSIREKLKLGKWSCVQDIFGVLTNLGYITERETTIVPNINHPIYMPILRLDHALKMENFSEYKAIQEHLRKIHQNINHI